MAIVCPITLNDEIGQYEFTGRMDEGRFCFPLAQYPVEVELHLRKTAYSPLVEGSSVEEIVADFVTNPAKNKALELQTQADHGEMRKHAVCTVLTFKNKFTGTVFSRSFYRPKLIHIDSTSFRAVKGSMLYMFTAYYQLMGWR